MTPTRTELFFRRIDDSELALCLYFNRYGRNPAAREFFAFISRLGNGVLWYALIAVLPVCWGRRGLIAAIQMICVAVVGLLIYRSLKTRLGRLRPYASHEAVECGTAPLDWYSFPSGHTLHAFAFTIVLVAYFPAFAVLAVPFTALVALSRVVLGLHYPSDVAAGAAIGSLLAWTSFLVHPLAA